MRDDAGHVAGEAGHGRCSRPGTGRIMVSPEAEQQMLYSYVKDPQLDFLGHRLAEWYNFNLLDSFAEGERGVHTLRPAHL